MSKQNLIVPMAWVVTPTAFVMDAKHTMTEKGMSSCQIAKRVGLPNSSVWDILQGRRKPNGREMLGIAAGLGLIKFYDPPAKKGLFRRAWEMTKKGWAFVAGLIGLPASAVALIEFFRG